MTSRGRVREWHRDEGWGVIDSEHTPGGCWAHCSSVQVAGYRALEAGQVVSFRHENADQDGFTYRAVELWPAGQGPVAADHEISGPTEAYRGQLFRTRPHGEPPSPDSE
jgi:CspA family cold shock protein